MCLSLLLLVRHPTRVLLRQPSPDRSRLFWSEVEGQVFFILVEDAELRALVGVDHSQDLSDRLAEVVANVTC